MKKIISGILLMSAVFASCVRDNVKNPYSPSSVTPSIFVVSTTGASSFDIPAQVSDTTIKISSNVWWSVQSADNVPWCSYTIDGLHIGYALFNFTLEPNVTDQDRVFNITLKADDPVEYTQTFVLTQKFSSEKFAFSKEIKLRTDSSTNVVLMPKFEASLPFDLTTNSAWKIVSDASWCTVVGPATGQPGVNLPVAVLCASNPTADYRHATVSVMTPDNVVLMKFDITQSNKFDAPTLTVTNDDQRLYASWTSTDGVSGYGVVIYDSLNVALKQITLASNVLNFDMTDFASATGLTNYVGQIHVAVRALTPDPTFFAESAPVLTNSHFADNGGNGMSASGRFIISNDRHLRNVSTAYSKGFFCYLLGYSPDLSGKALPSIGTALSPFAGDFDGGSKNGMTVANSAYERATVDASFTYYGMFGYVGNQGSKVSQIANFNFNNCMLTIAPAFSVANACWAIGVGSSNGATISNIKTTNCKIVLNTKPTGGNTANESIGMIVGAQTGGRITKCTTESGSIGRVESTTTGNHAIDISMGGIAGRIVADATRPVVVVDSCANISTSVNSYMAGGGIIATATVNPNGKAQVIQCYNQATITAASSVSGIVGALITTSATAAELLFDRCWNSGSIAYLQSNGPCMMGGILGNANVSVALTMQRCFNSGSITFDTNEGSAVLTRVNDVGGLGGWMAGTTGPSSCRIYECYNRGKVTYRVGGLSGALYLPGGATSGTQNAAIGGIAGFAGGAGTTPALKGNTQNCYNSGEVRVILDGASSATVSVLGNLFGRSNGTQTNQPFYNTVYVLNAFIGTGTTPITAVVGMGAGATAAANFTSGLYPFTVADLATQTKFQALHDNGLSFDFTNTWDMSNGYPILRGLYGNPVQ